MPDCSGDDAVRRAQALVDAVRDNPLHLPDGTVVGYEPLVDDVAAFTPFLPVPEEHGTAVVDLGDGAVLMSADAPRTAGLYAARGLEVVTVPITEFERLEGCVTCLSFRIRA